MKMTDNELVAECGDILEALEKETKTKTYAKGFFSGVVMALAEKRR